MVHNKRKNVALFVLLIGLPICAEAGPISFTHEAGGEGRAALGLSGGSSSNSESSAFGPVVGPRFRVNGRLISGVLPGTSALFAGLVDGAATSAVETTEATLTSDQRITGFSSGPLTVNGGAVPAFFAADLISEITWTVPGDPSSNNDVEIGWSYQLSAGAGGDIFQATVENQTTGQMLVSLTDAQQRVDTTFNASPGDVIRIHFDGAISRSIPENTTVSGGVGFNNVFSNITSVPEPSTLVMAGVSLGLLLIFRRRLKR